MASCANCICVCKLPAQAHDVRVAEVKEQESSSYQENNAQASYARVFAGMLLCTLKIGWKSMQISSWHICPALDMMWSPGPQMHGRFMI